jgi:neural Wiskott-Aldrich syndrome protein
MHYSLKPDDRAKIKRAIPAVNNKTIIAAVARLYIAFPNPNKWNFTGLSGAIVLAKDLFANTYFLKLVDVIGTGHVLWDQELWTGFEYNQDRTFFHSFEVEGYVAGLSFTEESEGKLFFKAVSSLELGARIQSPHDFVDGNSTAWNRARGILASQ